MSSKDGTEHYKRFLRHGDKGQRIIPGVQRRFFIMQCVHRIFSGVNMETDDTVDIKTTKLQHLET